ncbi:MAG TPA: MFS transporter [Methylomirabilota bacterium]|nr:MFS transporter [Methylomirabilota bacterium]
MTFPSGLRALDHRDFRLFWTGQLVSLIGTWMQSVAQSWLVLQLSGSPLKLGLIGTFQFAPVLLFSVVAGALVDRLPKRRLILATQTLLALQAFTLTALVWTGHVRYWHVAVLALLLGCANVIDMPTRQAFIVEMVGRGDLVNAVALNSAAFNGARIVGPALAGLLIGRFGLAPAFLLNGLSFLAVLGALSLVRAEGAPRPRAATTMGEDVLAGLRYALSTPRVALMLSLVLIVSLCVMNFSVFVPLLARNVLRLDAAGFGFLMAALGVGAVTGALSLATLGGRQTPLRAILLAGVLACLTLLGLAAAPEFHAAVVLLFLTGFFSIVCIASCSTTLQLAAPDELRGRVMSLHTLMFGGSFPLGAFMTGAIAEAFGVAAALVAAAGAGLAGLAAIALWWRSQRL